MGGEKKSDAGKVDGRRVIWPHNTTPISISYGIITNITNSIVTINLMLERQHQSHYIIPAYTQLQAGSSLELPDGRVLHPNDKMILLSSGSVDFFMSFM